MDSIANGAIGAEILGALRSVWKERSLSVRVKIGMFDYIVVPVVLYGCEAWAVYNKFWKSMAVLEIKCLRTMCHVRWIDHIRNDMIRESCSSKKNIYEKTETCVLK